MSKSKTVIANMTIERGSPGKPDTVQPGQPFEIPAGDPDRFVERGIAREPTDQDLAAIRVQGTAAPVEIPADWQNLSAAELVTLAHALGAGEDVKTKAAALEHVAKVAAERAPPLV